MKTQTIMIVASVVVIALALTAVSGITYSWYSDDEQTEITISAGRIDYELKITSLKDQSSYDRAEATDITSEYDFGVSAKAKVETATNAITLSNLADRDAIKIGMKITNSSTIATVYRVSATYNGDLYEYITSTIMVGSTEVTDVTPWMNVAAPATPTTTDASITIAFDSSNAELADDANVKITLKVEAYQENCTDLPPYVGYTVTKKVTAGATVSQTFKGNSDVGSTSVSFAAAAEGDYSISSITVTENSSYTIQKSGASTSNEVLSGISVSADGKDLSNQTAVLSFTLGSTLVNPEGTGLADAISIVHQKSDGTTETINLTTAVSAEPAAVGEYKLTKNADGTYTLNMFVKGFSSYLVVADADAYVVDEDGKKTYYTTFGKALRSNGTGTVGSYTGTYFNDSLTLLRDVELTECVAVQYFSGTLDGNGHTIFRKTNDHGGLFGVIAYYVYGGAAEIKNLEYKMMDGGSVLPLISYSNDLLTFSNVEISEASLKTGNGNSPYLSKVYKGTTTFTDCVNRASLYSVSDPCYAGIFVGACPLNDTTTNFINCVNYGNMRMSGPGIYIGSSSQLTDTNKDSLKITATNCVNYGVIEYTSFGPYTGGKTAVEIYSGYTDALANGTKNEGSFINLNDTTSIALTKDTTTGKISITKSADENVKSYKVSYSAFAEMSCASGESYGLMPTNISLNIDPESTVTEYTLIDKDSYVALGKTITGSWIKSGSIGCTYQIIDEYIVLNYDIYDYKFVINVKPTLYLSAYDSSGKLMATVAMTETTATTDAS